MSQERIYILIARKMAGEATEGELKELDQLLGRDPEMRYSWGIINGLEDLDDADRLCEAAETDVLERSRRTRDAQLELENQARSGGRSVRVIRSMALASVVVVMLAAGGFFLFHRRAVKTVFGNEITTKVASKSTIVLPDGSKVSLNSCSRLIYADGFSKGNRTVTLYGEGYFEVKHDPEHPFIIHAGNAEVKVLGTTLNVKAYPEDNTLVTTLIRGKVEIDFNSAAHQAVVLKPGQKITICKNRVGASPKTAPSGLTDFTVSAVKRDPGHPIPEIAWTNDDLEFTSETFGQLSHDLARRYDVQFHFQNGKYQQEIFSGAFGRQDIGEVMHALQLTSDFHYRIDSLKDVYVW